MAEAAAAEDFDPLRIRPFVEVGDNSAPPDASTTSSEAESTGTDEQVDAARKSGATQQPTLLQDLGSAPTSPLEDGPNHTPAPRDEHPSADSTQDRRRRRRRAVLATGAGAAAAVLVTGGFVGGLFSYTGPVRDGSQPDGMRASVPEKSSGSDTSSVSPSSTVSAPEPSETSPSSPAASPATPTGSTTPTESKPSADVTATAAPAPSTSDGVAPVLRFGDSGPEVTELQLRLRQIGFYNGDINGNYDRQVENAVSGYQLTRVILRDESGVYGKETRTSLESETSEP
ncbi:peptidoglycan-binding domain-containing protein [Streptomyces dysideae]|nr:peptidoglycan-binding domain-containing protein [Streptomyces dysideae]